MPGYTTQDIRNVALVFVTSILRRRSTSTR
jgi:hypothetical protein